MSVSPRTLQACARGLLRALFLGCLSGLAGMPPGTVAAAPPAAAGVAADADKAARDLAAIRAEIARVSEQIGRDAAARDRLSRDLKTAEGSVTEARTALERLRVERDQRGAHRAELARERQQAETELERERASLAAAARAAYLIGRQEPLELFLNQRDPSRLGRMFAYYGYFGRARAGTIASIEAHLKELEQLDAALEDEETRLAALATDRSAELKQLETARARRAGVLASLEAESASRSQNLERLTRQQAGLEQLVRELKRALERFPSDHNDAFGKLRGALAWPVAGKLVARFGETRAGGIRWDGMLVATQRDEPVRAVSQGRVIYADWLSGLGLLVILDHGDGYLSLYGYNDRLLKSVGDRVAAGDPIAAAGDTGGRARPELYFEIRKAGRPIDPAPWFRSPAP